MGVADAAMALLPRRRPERAALERCRIVSHRGEHDNRGVRENTLAAFAAARDAGVWGIEFDVRFTADLVPVVCHDPDTARVFGRDLTLSAVNFASLRSACPEIPTLAEVLDEFGADRHLMIELKAEPWPDPQGQAGILADLLAPLTPVADYHLLSLDAGMFDRVGFAPATCCMPVAELNVRAMSELALQRGYAGIGGHYLLLGERLRRRHAAVGQQLGVGFPASANCLARELNRGIQWIFSNDAAKLQQVRDSLL